MRKNKALFLDRDGVINEDKGYVHKKDDFIFVSGIFDLCKYAGDKGYRIIVVTNQAGIGKGFYTTADFLLLNSWMCEKFAEHGICISKVFYCPYHIDAVIPEFKKAHFCRKPNPGMLYQARDQFDLDLPLCAMVGDRMTDVAAGMAAGVRTNILLGSEASESTSSGYHSVSTLIEVKKFL